MYFCIWYFERFNFKSIILNVLELYFLPELHLNMEFSRSCPLSWNEKLRLQLELGRKASSLILYCLDNVSNTVYLLYELSKFFLQINHTFIFLEDSLSDWFSYYRNSRKRTKLLLTVIVITMLCNIYMSLQIHKNIQYLITIFIL